MRMLKPGQRVGRQLFPWQVLFWELAYYWIMLLTEICLTIAFAKIIRSFAINFHEAVRVDEGKSWNLNPIVNISTCLDLNWPLFPLNKDVIYNIVYLESNTNAFWLNCLCETKQNNGLSHLKEPLIVL